MAHRGRPGNLYMHGKDLLANMEVLICKWSDSQFTPPCPDRSGDSAQECDRERFSQRGQHGSAGKPALAQHVHSLTSVSENLFGYDGEVSVRSSKINLIQSPFHPSFIYRPPACFGLWSVGCEATPPSRFVTHEPPVSLFYAHLSTLQPPAVHSQPIPNPLFHHMSIPNPLPHHMMHSWKLLCRRCYRH